VLHLESLQRFQRRRKVFGLENVDAGIVKCREAGNGRMMGEIIVGISLAVRTTVDSSGVSAFRSNTTRMGGTRVGSSPEPSVADRPRAQCRDRLQWHRRSLEVAALPSGTARC